MSSRAIILAGAIGLQAATCLGQNVTTIHLKVNKTVLHPGEILTIECYARIEPGIGGATTYTDKITGQQYPAIVDHWAATLFDLRTVGRDGIWHSLTFNSPILTPPGGQNIPYPWGMWHIKAINPFNGPPIVADDTLICTLKWSPYQANLPGVVTLTPELPPGPSYGGIGVYVPELGEKKLQAWLQQYEPLQVQIVPGPGVAFLPMLAAIATIARRRRCHE